MTEPLSITFDAVQEARPGPKWRDHFERLWPAHRAWFLREGEAARPSYLESERQLNRHLPAFVPTWNTLIELTGGGDLVARYLAQFRPPPFFAACSQLICTKTEPALLRSYDYSPLLCDGLITQTAWSGRRVIGMSDSMVGLLDGMNEDGLAVSLAFGGRRVQGAGFGIGVVLRHVLETCSTVAEAAKELATIPIHVAYNIALVDACGAHATVMLAPDRAPVVDESQVSTNHQGAIDWPEYARLLETERRYNHLNERLHDPNETLASVASRFLEPPLYRTDYLAGYGTLYAALYLPARREVRYLWPGLTVTQTFQKFSEQMFVVEYHDGEGAKRA